VKEDLPLGNWYDVKITGSTITYLIGETRKHPTGAFLSGKTI